MVKKNFDDICITIQTEYRRVTDGRTDWHLATALSARRTVNLVKTRGNPTQRRWLPVPLAYTNDSAIASHLAYATADFTPAPILADDQALQQVNQIIARAQWRFCRGLEDQCWGPDGRPARPRLAVAESFAYTVAAYRHSDHQLRAPRLTARGAWLTGLCF